MTQHAGRRPVVPAESLREQVEQSVSAHISSGEFPPGEVLTAPSLANAFGVSATPVREALLNLVRRGFVEPVRNKGFRVTEVRPEDLAAITAVRRLLEVPPMREVAGHITPSMRRRLDALAGRISRAYDARRFEEYLAADLEFHTTILGVTGNQRLVDIVTDLRTQTRLHGLVLADTRDSMRASLAEHAQLVELLVDGKGDEAAELMDLHLSHVSGIWSAIPEAGDQG